MAERWTAARLGLVSLSVLALAACSRNVDGDAPAAPAASSAELAADDASALAVEPLGPSEAAEPLAPAASTAAAQASAEIADARAFDTGVTNAAANTVEAYSYDQGGEAVRVWNDPRLGSRIMTPGPDGFVISYFRAGAAQPYLLRQRDVFYVLDNGRIVRAYDLRGRPVTVRTDVRDTFDRLIVRTREVKRESDRRRASYARAVRQDRQADAAARDAQQANREANQAEGRADRAADRARDARREAQDARREADTPAERRDAQQAVRDANQARNQADRAANRARDSAGEAREARQEAVQERQQALRAAQQLRNKCERQRERGGRVDADCANVR